MKFRESGMPDEEMWSTFFDPTQVLIKMGLNINSKLIVDVGCGYGTFLIPAANLIEGTVVGLDIEQELINLCQAKVDTLKLNNVALMKRDIFLEGYHLDQGSADGVFLFNLLHCELPQKILQDTYKVLNGSGKLYVIHWNYNDTTPRGPSMDIRPRPDQIISWAANEGFTLFKHIDVDTYHYGLVFSKG